MRKTLICFAAVLCLGACAAARSSAWSDFWDYPHVIAKTSDSVVKADVKAVDLGEKTLIFFLNQGQKSAEILCVPTEDFVGFGEPFPVKRGMELISLEKVRCVG